MSSDIDVSKLDISKNLLQMNFMKRTLIAKQKNQAPIKSDELPTSEDFKYSMPSSVLTRLSKRLALVSKL